MAEATTSPQLSNDQINGVLQQFANRFERYMV